MKRILLTSLVVVVLAGCVTEPQKVANDQMRQAGERGSTDTGVMLTGMAAADYAFNQVDVLQRLEAIRLYFDDIVKLAKANQAGFGAPREPKPYQPGKTKDVEDAASKTWYALAGAAAMALVYRAAVTYLPALAGPWGSLATSLVTGLAKGRVTAEGTTSAPDAIKSVLSSLKSEQQKVGVFGFATKWMDKVEAALDIDHKVTLKQ